MNTLTDTTTTELLPLFQEWAEIESDRCRIFHLSAEIINIEVKLDGRWEPIWSIHLSGLTASSKAIVQAVVQEAIEDRYVHPSITLSLGEGLNKLAEISCPSAWGLDETQEGIGGTPAIALLTAYLQALKAARAAA